MPIVRIVIAAWLALFLPAAFAQTQLGADVDASAGHLAETSESFARFARLTSPSTSGMVLDNIKIRLPATSSARVALYSGGTSDADPAGATLIFEGLASNATGADAVVTVTAAQQAIPAGARLWLAHKGTNENRYYVYTVGNPHPADGADSEAGDLLSAVWIWGPLAGIDTDTTDEWPSTVPSADTEGGNAPQMALTYSIASEEDPPTLSSPTPSGTLGTETTATVGATSTASTGTFYAILSTSNNAIGASCTQIKAGQNSTGASASFAEDDTVSTTSPSVGFTGLTGSTLYYAAACHADANGDSNVVATSFTTAAADIVATKLIFGSQPGNVVVGQTFGAFTVRAVNASDALDTDFVDDVTVALQTGNGALAGTLTETAVAGIATFDDVHIDTLNTDAVIRATADGLTAADSDEFDVTAGAGGGTSGFPSSSRLGGVLQ